ncbi:hypothetical protein [Stenotrophomonas maltophilia]|uniref:hypothetical protein n=1 Tax=Stenotrophomonas maltophilia TaxID=40324 RepID=UPI00066ED57D|nr:hypothetical protein [Stenotrophomonas maltophilia]
MKKIIENEITFGLIEEMLRIGLKNDEEQLKQEYRIAIDLANELFGVVEPGSDNYVAWFESELTRGLPFDAILLGQERRVRKDNYAMNLYVKSFGEKVKVDGVEEIILFILFQKCRHLECYSLYERRILSEMFKPESEINQGRSVIAEWLK